METLLQKDFEKETVVIQINGVTNENNDDHINASDDDVETWFGLVSKIDDTNTFAFIEGYDEVDVVNSNTIAKIWKNPNLKMDKIQSAKSMETELLKGLTPLLKYLSENAQRDTFPNNEVNILELCSGKKSVESTINQFINQAFSNLKCKVTTVDIEKRFNPDLELDVTKWEEWKELKDENNQLIFEPGKYDLVVFTPDCTEYSAAKTIGCRNLKKADKLVQAGLDFIFKYLKPRFFIMENPASGKFALHKQKFMAPYEKYRNETTYCHYGFPYRKLTSIWSNIPQLQLKNCLVLNCEYFAQNSRHSEVAQRGSKLTDSGFIQKGQKTAENLYQIPSLLILHMLEKFFKAIIDEDKENWTLNSLTFKTLLDRYKFDIEAFATYKNRQLSKFWSLKKEPESSAIDAFSQSWNNRKLYINPPFSQMQKVVDKISEATNSEFTVIAPAWEQKKWWNQLKKLCQQGGEFYELPAGTNFFKPKIKYAKEVPSPDWPVFCFHIKCSEKLIEQLKFLQLDQKEIFISCFT